MLVMFWSRAKCPAGTVELEVRALPAPSWARTLHVPDSVTATVPVIVVEASEVTHGDVPWFTVGVFVT